MGPRGRVTHDERNTFEEVFEAFEKNETAHPARHAVEQARKAITTLDNRNWNLHFGRSAVAKLENATATIEKIGATVRRSTPRATRHRWPGRTGPEQQVGLLAENDWQR